MTTTLVTLIGDVTDAIGTDFDTRRTKAYVRYNTDKVVTDGDEPIHLGGGTVNVSADGTFSLPDVVAATSLVENLLATVYIAYSDPTIKGNEARKTATFGPYDLSAETGTVDIRDLEAVQALPASAISQATAALDAIVAEGQALLDAQEIISGLTGEDDAVALLIDTPGSDTANSLAASIDAQVPVTGDPIYRRQRKATIALFGDSRTDSCDSSSGGGWFSTNLSWWDFGQAAAGGARFDVVASAGVAGNTTTQMLARMDADVIAYSPGYMTLWGGTNDNWAAGTSAVDASFANMVAMMEKARLAGIYTFLISETTASTNGTTFPAHVAYYNDKLRRYAAENAEVEYWDFNAVFTDPALSTGYPKAALTSDGLHLSVAGASAIGVNAVAPALARFPKITNLVCSQLDVQAINAASRNVLGNPMMLNTNGTVGTGFTGTMPSSWAVARSNSNVSGTVTTTARADGVGSDIVCAATASAAGSANLTSTVNIARLTAGQQYVIECAYEISSPSNLFALTVALQEFYNAGANSDTFGACWSVSAAVGTSANDTILAHSGVLRSRIFTSRVQNDLSTAQLLVQARFAGAGSATVKFGRPSIKRVS